MGGGGNSCILLSWAQLPNAQLGTCLNITLGFSKNKESIHSCCYMYQYTRYIASFLMSIDVAVSSVFSDLILPPHSYQGSDPILLSIIVPIVPFGPSYAPDCVIVMWQHILKNCDAYLQNENFVTLFHTLFNIMTRVIIRNSLTTYNVIPIQTSHSDFSLSAQVVQVHKHIYQHSNDDNILGRNSDTS